MAITGDQLRMARAALKMTIREVSELTGIDKSTVVRTEAGGKAYYQTISTLQALFERLGIEFIDPIEGVRGQGVCFKWGADVPQRQPGEGTAAGTDGETGIKAAWDDIEGDADLDALLSEEPGLNPDMAEMWQADPELWARLSQGGRETLSRSMFGDCRAAGEGYFRGGLEGAAMA